MTTYRSWPSVLAVASFVATVATAFGARAADAPEPAAGPTTVTLTPARPKLLLGTDTQVEVTLDVRGPESETFAPIRALANVGTLETPHATGAPGHFTARYVPPPERYPQIALLVVELASGARRMHVVARIALEGSTVVPFHTSPGAAVTMRVGDRSFGPVTADQKGRVEIPILVPPGVRAGIARAVDHNGAARETEVDLQLAPYVRMVVLAPPTLDVGSFSEIVVLAVEADGAPVNPTRLTLSASAGLLHPLGAGPLGAARFLFEAPRQLGSGAVALTAIAAGTPPSRTDMAVALRVGAPARLAIAPSSRRLIVGSGEGARVAVSAHDAFGNLTSAAGVEITVDGRPRPVAFAPGGLGTLTVEAPVRFDGKDRVVIDARLGTIRASEELHVTGGPPARLTMGVRDARLIADGHQSTELRVQAVDRNGTPTAVPGLSWDTPEGRVRHVRMPHDGEYIAEYVPDRTREPQRQVVSVMASQALRANATVDVSPPPVRLVAGARVGLFYNLGQAAGPAAFLEALKPLPIRRLAVFVGGAIGYLNAEISGAGPDPMTPAHMEIDQVPFLAIARARIPLLLRFELSGDVAAGMTVGHTKLTTSSGGHPFDASGSSYSPALGGGADVGLLLKPGRLVFGLRYLWSRIGRTSQGDEVTGNSAGLIGDIGYRMTF